MSISSCQASRQTTCLPIYAWDPRTQTWEPGMRLTVRMFRKEENDREKSKNIERI